MATTHECATAQSTTLPESNETITSELPQSSLSRGNLLLGLGLGAAAVASKELVEGDEDRIAHKLDHFPFEGAIDAADLYGSGVTMGAASLGLLAVGRATGNARLYAVGKDLSSSMLLTWSAVWALKLTNAKRPNGGAYSFPSGHTATAFAAAPVLGKHFGPKATYAAYAMGILTGLGRMEDKKHYLADVLAGAGIGLVVSRELTGGNGFAWSTTPDFPGIGVSARF